VDLFGGQLVRTTPSGFPDIWNIWPRKVARIAAEKAYKAALKKPGVTPAFLVERAVLYSDAVQHREPTFVLHLATWLHGERWNDDLETEARNGEPGTTSHERRGDERLARLGRYHAASHGSPDQGE
jgi:hypothetical protein